MNYDEAILYLENCHKFGSKQGHDNFKKLMTLLGEPQKKLKVIHIAGTNGKGSTCAMIYSILSKQGYSTGLFSSPHLERYNERIYACGEYISDYDFVRHIEIVKNKVAELFQNTEDFFSFFEIITAVAFSYFNEKKLDFVILEVGLGGRLDSTNIIENPIVSVITTINFDHTEYLGNTISEIAKEKAGIIKNNSPVVLYSQTKEVYNIIKDICNDKNSKLYYVDDYGINVLKKDFEKTIFNAKNNEFDYDNIVLSLCGDYQIKNACNVLMLVKALRNQGFIISDKAIYDGLENAKINGRMQIVKKEPLFILEGAHNVEGAGCLNQFMKNLKKSNKTITVIIGILKDKNYNEMIKMLTEFADKIIFTEADNKRAIKSNKFSELFNSYEKQFFIEEDFKKAISIALNISGKNDCIICTGSLYLVGDVLKYFNQGNTD